MLAAGLSGGQVKLSRMDPLERIVRFRARTVLAVLGIILAVFALLQIVSLAREVLTWMLIAVFFALALDPLVNLLMRRGIPRRGLAIGVTYLLLLCVVVILGLTFIPTLVDEVNNFIDAVPQYVQDLTEGRGRLGFLETDYHLVERVREAAAGTDISRILGVSGTAVAVTKGVVTVIAATITIVVLTFFMLLEGPRWVERFYELLPASSQPRWRRIGKDVYATVGGFVAGAMAIALLAGITSSLLLIALGVSYAIALGLVVFVLDLIPLAGATIASVLVTTVAVLDQGWTVGLIVLGWFIVYQQVENHVLYPLIYSKTVALSPLTILVAVLIGASLAGVLGALAAIPIAGTIQVLRPRAAQSPPGVCRAGRRRPALSGAFDPPLGGGSRSRLGPMLKEHVRGDSHSAGARRSPCGGGRGFAFGCADARSRAAPSPPATTSRAASSSRSTRFAASTASRRFASTSASALLPTRTLRRWRIAVSSRTSRRTARSSGSASRASTRRARITTGPSARTSSGRRPTLLRPTRCACGSEPAAPQEPPHRLAGGRSVSRRFTSRSGPGVFNNAPVTVLTADFGVRR